MHFSWAVSLDDIKRQLIEKEKEIKKRGFIQKSDAKLKEARHGLESDESVLVNCRQ